MLESEIFKIFYYFLIYKNMLNVNNLFLKKSWELRVPFWLYDAMTWVGFMTKVCLSLSYVFWCGCFLICLMCRCQSASFGVSFWETCCMRNYTFGVFLTRRKLRWLLCCQLSLLWLSLIIFISNPRGINIMRMETFSILSTAEF